jgi:hypothetical protein
MSESDRTVGLRPLLTIDALLVGITSVGATPSGELRLIPIASGQFEGPELRGEVLPGGADWQDVRSDGVLEISARYLLKTDQGELIDVRSVGLRAAPAEVLAQLARGERVPRNAYYFRTAMRFRTASLRLGRFNDVLAVAYGERSANGVHLEVYEVL